MGVVIRRRIPHLVGDLGGVRGKKERRRANTGRSSTGGGHWGIDLILSSFSEETYIYLIEHQF